MANKKLYIVETISIFRMSYLVEALEEGHALDEVVCNLGDFEEFNQKHLDETIVSSREVDEVEYLKIFDKENDYLKGWTPHQKLQFMRKIDYTPEEIEGYSHTEQYYDTDRNK